MTYRLVFSGQIRDDLDESEVKRRLLEQLPLSSQTVDKLFTPGRKVLKKGVDQAACQKIAAAFERAGAICAIEPDQTETASTGQPPDSGLPVPEKNALQTDAAPPVPHDQSEETRCRTCNRILAPNASECPFCRLDRPQEASRGLLKGATLMGIGLLLIPICGIIAAIAIPQYVAYRNRAVDVEAQVRHELERVVSAQKEYFSTHGIYTLDPELMGYAPENPNVQVDLIAADKRCFLAAGRHRKDRSKLFGADCNGVQSQSVPGE